MRRQRTRSLPAVGLAAAVLLSVSACGSDEAERCAEAFTAAATSVAGVSSAEWDCDFSFGGGSIRGDVVVEATTKDEAVAVMDEVLQAFAAAPDLEDGWSTPQDYWNEDHTIGVGANDLGFNGAPNVGEVREHYDITPG